VWATIADRKPRMSARRIGRIQKLRCVQTIRCESVPSRSWHARAADRWVQWVSSLAKKFCGADLQDLGDLAGGVHRDVDPAAFERADVIAAFVDGGETNWTLGQPGDDRADVQDHDIEAAGWGGLEAGTCEK